jgi:hypothetical protein
VFGLLIAAPVLAQQGGAQPAGAGQKAAPQPDPAKPQPQLTDAERVVTRVYDVRDLTMGLKQYPFRGAMLPARQTQNGIPPVEVMVERGRAPTTAPSSPAAATDAREPSAQEREDELVRLLTETVAPESWRDAGGTTGSIRLLDPGRMVVTQTVENHTLLVQLLDQFRETRARMVRVRAHWLVLPQDDADKLFAPAGGAGRQPETALVSLDPGALRSLPKDAVQFQAQTLGYNTQTVHVVSGPARTVVSDVDVQVGTGVAGFDPVVELVRSGLVLEVTPLITSDNRSVVLDLYSAFVEPPKDGKPLPIRALAAASPPPPAGARAQTGPADVEPAPALAEGVIDRLGTTIQELRTTVQVPLNRPVLIGGMTIAPSLTGQPSPTMYLVVEVVASE